MHGLVNLRNSHTSRICFCNYLAFLFHLACLYVKTDTIVLKVQQGCRCPHYNLRIFELKTSFKDSVIEENLNSYVKAVHLFLYLIPVAVDIHLHLSSLMLPQFGQMLIVTVPDCDF